MDYFPYVAALACQHPKLADAFARSDSIETVLDWMKDRNLPANAVDIVGQDEFSYDFLVRLDDEGRWLAFGVN